MEVLERGYTSMKSRKKARSLLVMLVLFLGQSQYSFGEDAFNESERARLIYEKYWASPVQGGQEFNRLVTAPIGSVEWLGPTLNPVDTRTIDETFQDSVGELSKTWIDIRGRHQTAQTIRRLALSAGNIMTDVSGTLGPGPGTLAAGLASSSLEAFDWWKDKQAELEGAAEVALLRRGFDLIDEAEGAKFSISEANLLNRVDQLLSAEGPFGDVDLTVKDALQDYALKNIAKAVDQLNGEFTKTDSDVGELMEDFEDFKSQLQSYKTIQTEQVNNVEKVKVHLASSVAKAKSEKDKENTKAVAKSKEQKAAQRAAAEYALQFQKGAAIAGQVGDLAKSLGVNPKMVRDVRRGQAILGAAMVGARLYAGDPTAAMQVLPALTGLANAFGGGGKSESQQMVEAILAAIQQLSELIERNHKEVMSKLDGLEDIVLINQSLLVSLHRGTIANCHSLFPRDWYSTYSDPSNDKLKLSPVDLNPRLPLRYASYDKMVTETDSALLNGCLGASDGNSGIAYHFTKKFAVAADWSLFKRVPADDKVIRLGGNKIAPGISKAAKRAFESQAALAKVSMNNKSMLVGYLADDSVVREDAVQWFGAPSRSVYELEFKLRGVELGRKAVSLLASARQRSDIDFLLQHRTQIVDPVKVRRYTTYALAAQPIYDVYRPGGAMVRLPPLEDVLGDDFNANVKNGLDVLYGAKRMLTLAIGQETISQGDLLLPIFHVLATNGPNISIGEYESEISFLSDQQWLPDDDELAKKELDQLRANFSKIVKTDDLLTYNLAVFGISKDVASNALYRAAMSQETNTPERFNAIGLQNWDFRYRAPLVSEVEMIRALRTAIAVLEEKEEVGFEISRKNIRARMIDLFRRNKPYLTKFLKPKSDSLYNLERRTRNLTEKQFELLTAALPYPDAVRADSMKAFAKTFKQELEVDTTFPSGWSIRVLGSRFAAPSADAIDSGALVMTPLMEDLIHIRNRVVEAIAGYEWIEWAKVDSTREQDLKVLFLKTPMIVR